LRRLFSKATSDRHFGNTTMHCVLDIRMAIAAKGPFSQGLHLPAAALNKVAKPPQGARHV
jgi:hypothetical protein